ncbi:hypothetical protein [Roseovarius sp. M141]|uniref:hypothetical protein n=1 Tax=Roseovarius sp. M141 TaxID=2583806 RepID=UPI0020CDB210|nr:hypothetical protein [Roseovarius sp. M141]MCQ0090919.1 hypothetical protein [Roseovarius sp. M141]
MSDIRIEEVTNLIRDAGGRIVGRTRLQKIAYLLTATGLDDSFRFAYKHYGPFSEELASSAKFGALFGNLNERQDQTAWGGTYSTYTIDNVQELEQGNPRHSLATLAAAADSIELELAATAVFLAHDGYDDPRNETAQRKPEKATAVRLANAKALLASLSQIDVPTPIPQTLLA